MQLNWIHIFSYKVMLVYIDFTFLHDQPDYYVVIVFWVPFKGDHVRIWSLQSFVTKTVTNLRTCFLTTKKTEKVRSRNEWLPCEITPWNSIELHGIPWKISHGVLGHVIPWNSVEFHGNNNRLGSSMEIAPWSCCMEFNGKFSMEHNCILNEFPWNLMERHYSVYPWIHWWKHFTDHALPLMETALFIKLKITLKALTTSSDWGTHWNLLLFCDQALHSCKFM